MKEKQRTKRQLIDELVEMRQRLAEFEASETGRKQVENELRVSEKKYGELADLLPQTVFELDEGGNFTFVNLNSIEIFGHTLKESDTGWPALQMFAPEDRHRAKENFQRVLSGEELGGAEYTALTKDGSRFPIVVHASPIIEGNKAVGMRGIAIDITERKQVEEALRESEEKLRLTFESVMEGITVSDLSGKILQVNEAVVRMHGYNGKDELCGQSIFRLIAEGDRAMAMANLKRTLEGEYIKENAGYIFLTKDGREFDAELSAAVLRDASGNPVGFVAVTRDVTEHKQTEEQLIITDRLASVGELASGIAHELNNPLTSIIGFAQLLLGKDAPDDVKEDIGTIYREAQRTAEVVKNLLSFARKHTPAKQPINIDGTIENVLGLRAYEQRVSNIQVNTQFTPDLPEVMADYFQLQQVFLNIIINAEHFMIEAHNGGTLTITTEKVGDTIKASFTDDGLGISKENLGHLFDPFFTTKEVGKGTGLGLSICHGIVIEHGGRIYAESEWGQGATFVVQLPIIKW
jgi:two-component system NtrC family sensor kinase